VLSRILGRQRNLIAFPDGTKKWPSLGTSDASLAAFFKKKQMQFTQHTVDHIEVKVTGPASPVHTEVEIEKKLQKHFGYPFKITFTYVDQIPRDASGKFEDFKSLIS
jgi:phenylacetate-CoA ligase